MASQTSKLECQNPVCPEFGKSTDFEIDTDTWEAYCWTCQNIRDMTEQEISILNTVNETKLQDQRIGDPRE